MGGGLLEHMVGGTFDRPPVHVGPGMLADRLGERVGEQREGVFLAYACGVVDDQRVVDVLVGRAAPGPYGVQVAAARLGLAEGEPYGGRALCGVGDAHHDTAVPALAVPFLAAHHDHRADGTGGHREAHRAEQHPRDAAASAGARDQGGGLAGRVQERRHRVLVHDAGRHVQVPAAQAGAFGSGRHDGVGHDLLGGAAGGEGRHAGLVPFPQRRVDDPQGSPSRAASSTAQSTASRLEPEPSTPTTRGSFTVSTAFLGCTAAFPLAVRLARAVQGVVDGEPWLTGEPAHRPE